ncbi:tRNA lysidine(34) synthetase TilS [Gracilibacillus sp. S3-1-1]|uniref:tRNA lysidine(34) synthetase TilS n=1 Tax=Gracilibacillus pellucidus TaxID=3095368 RepID=A0ACC6M9U1_9BACI|nr:tRNA lysidine(34) synthetase TilS [Gracilibacillus sp. S3-1-1]MDX8047714.1 tRNA lysidine(34) synthetase TilS [Gracilibacillus sp. S3-1-1]
MRRVSLHEKLMPFMKKHQLIHQDATVLVGVSGGADSLLLLHYLVNMKEQLRLKVIAVSVDHGLRGEESKEDVRYVKNICEQLQIPCITREVDVKSRKELHKEGTQVAARTLRYQAFEEVMQETKADFLALAHHGDDQVETVLMRLVRQSNPAALAGMPIKRRFAGGYIIRPFLPLSKEDIYQYCRELQLTPREDPSNQSITYTRNYFRLRVIPLLKEQESQVHHHVQEMTERMEEDQTYLLNEAEKMVEKVVTYKDSLAFFDISAFQSYPIALQRRAFHLILNYLYKKVPTDLNIQHEKDFFALLDQQKSNVTVDFPKSLKISKNYQELRFYFRTDVNKEWEVHQTINVPSEITLPNDATLKVEYASDPICENSQTLHIPIECESLFPLSIRVRKPGDRMTVRGLHGRKKVKDIFIDEKIPVYLRDSWPLIFGADGSLLWMAGLKKAEIKGKRSVGEYIVLTYTDLSN